MWRRSLLVFGIVLFAAGLSSAQVPPAERKADPAPEAKPQQTPPPPASASSPPASQSVTIPLNQPLPALPATPLPAPAAAPVTPEPAPVIETAPPPPTGEAAPLVVPTPKPKPIKPKVKRKPVEPPAEDLEDEPEPGQQSASQKPPSFRCFVRDVMAFYDRTHIRCYNKARGKFMFFAVDTGQPIAATVLSKALNAIQMGKPVTITYAPAKDLNPSNCDRKNCRRLLDITN
jgi:hypothetical protein